MRSFRILVAAAALVSLVGCGADASSGGPAETVAEGANGQGSPAPATAVSLIGGGTVDPEALSAATPVALWFWAPG